MSWRVVIITKRCKLEYKLGYLICRGEELKKVFLAEIDTLIIESTGVSVTAALLCELTKQKINVVFCDEKHNPLSQLLPLNGRFNASGCLRRQLEWTKQTRLAVWTEIVRLKILSQKSVLDAVGSDQAPLLAKYAEEVRLGDVSNREGHAAKVYFNALFGIPFKRGDQTFLNAALNYGYSIILSAFNREIVSNGFNTQLGIAHKNEFNCFNLSCDLMEPFRMIVDRFVFDTSQELTPDYKHSICNILNLYVTIKGERCTLTFAISTYCKSVFCALDTGNIAAIKCYEL